AGVGVGAYRGQWLIDFVGDRCRHLTQRGDARHMRQLSLRFLQRFFSPLLFAQIQHESDTLLTTSLEHRGANHHGHAAAILLKVLLLERLDRPSRLYLCEGTLVAVAPFYRRQMGPAEVTRHEIFMAVFHHT